LVAALVLALVSFAGTAVAGGLVTGRQVKDGSLGSVDLRTDRAVRGTDVRDGTLSARKMASLPQGPAGDQGSPGIDGVSGLDNFDYEISSPVDVGPTGEATISVPCAAGTVVGGGASSASEDIRIVAIRLLPAGSGWQVTVYNESASLVTAFGWAVCVSAP